jgi:GR25 family glycosyltransferase involved in LPS biosynthesis
MQAYCINLERSPERREIVQAEFEREGLDVTFFRATDGKVEAPDGLFITKSEWGCADSHIRVWRDMVENGHEMAIVFEDDITLSPNFTSKLHDILDELPNDWDYVNIGTTDGVYINFRKYSENLVVGQALNTHAYIISLKCAKMWAQWDPKYLKNQIDVFIVNYPSNNFHVPVALALQKGGASDIGSHLSRTFDWNFFIHKWGLVVAALIFLFLVRRVIFE